MLSEKQQAMVELWEAHVRYEFEDHDVDSTLTTMTHYPHILNIPTRAGGVGVEGCVSFTHIRFSIACLNILHPYYYLEQLVIIKL
tara:strand:+ start:276 stop:530 length:255 start_codon:yes stop_codon:yes gene_type:complete